VEDSEFKYGLSVTGLVHPARFLTNGTLKPGCALVLTKPLGTGVIATAVKGGLADEKTLRLLVETASMLNKKAAEILLDSFHPTALTDVTGFGLAGHSLEMARAGGVSIEISASKVPLMPAALDFARMGLLPAGCHVTRQFCRASCDVAESVELALADLMFDPQTSGGLLAALPVSEASDYAAMLTDCGITAAVVAMATGRHPGGRLVISP
jgi:selenide,water dikinase